MLKTDTSEPMTLENGVKAILDGLETLTNVVNKQTTRICILDTIAKIKLVMIRFEIDGF